MREYKFTISDEDYIEFSRYHLFNDKRSKKTLRKARWGVSALLFLVMVAVFSNGRGTPLYGMAVGAAVCLLWNIFFNNIIMSKLKDGAEKAK